MAKETHEITKTDSETDFTVRYLLSWELKYIVAPFMGAEAQLEKYLFTLVPAEDYSKNTS